MMSSFHHQDLYPKWHDASYVLEWIHGAGLNQSNKSKPCTDALPDECGFLETNENVWMYTVSLVEPSQLQTLVRDD